MPSLATVITTSRGVVRILAALIKPYARMLSGCFLLYRILVNFVLRRQRSNLAVPQRVLAVLQQHSQACLLFMASSLACWVDPVVSTDRFDTKPGVYAHGAASSRIVRSAGLKEAVDDAERTLWPKDGDFSTIVAAETWKLFHAADENLRYFRTLFPLCIPTRERPSTNLWTQNYMDTFAVDWFFRDPQQHRKLCELAAHEFPGGDISHEDELNVVEQLQHRERQVRFVRRVAHASVNSYLRTSTRTSDTPIALKTPQPGHNSEIVTPRGLAVLIPGVGGDSRAGYINAAARHFLDKDFNVCVLNPRGLADGHVVRDVHNIYDALDMSDLHSLLKLVHSQIPNPKSRPAKDRTTNTAAGLPSTSPCIVLVGFSLGAVSIVRYAHRMRKFLPPSVRAAVSVGGACNSEVAEWPRYKTIYQRIIVPKIRDDIVSMYTDQLADIYGSKKELLTKAAAITSYADLVTKFLGTVKQSQRDRLAAMNAHHQACDSELAGHTTAGTFVKASNTTAVWASTTSKWPTGENGTAPCRLTSAVWFTDEEFDLMRRNKGYDTWTAFRAQSTLYRVKTVAPAWNTAKDLNDMQLGCPVLLIAAANDPFHHTDSIVPGMTNHQNPNFIGLVTRYGGHIGWTRLSSQRLVGLDYNFIGEVAIRFTMSAMDEYALSPQRSEVADDSVKQTLFDERSPVAKVSDNKQQQHFDTMESQQVTAGQEENSETKANVAPEHVDLDGNGAHDPVSREHSDSNVWMPPALPSELVSASSSPNKPSEGSTKETNSLKLDTSMATTGNADHKGPAPTACNDVLAESSNVEALAPELLKPFCKTGLANFKSLVSMFVKRGGHVYLFPDAGQRTGDQAALLRAGDVVFPVCHAGQNRSQVMYALLQNMNLAASVPLRTRTTTSDDGVDELGGPLTVMPPHGAECGYDPYQRYSDVGPDNYFEFCHAKFETEPGTHDFWMNECFRAALGRGKSNRFGEEVGTPRQLMPLDFSDETLHRVEQDRSFMHEYFSSNFFTKPAGDQSRNVYLCSCRAVSICMERILEANPDSGTSQDFQDVYIVGFPDGDTIGKNLPKASTQAEKSALVEEGYRKMYEAFGRVVKFDG